MIKINKGILIVLLCICLMWSMISSTNTINQLEESIENLKNDNNKINKELDNIQGIKKQQEKEIDSLNMNIKELQESKKKIKTELDNTTEKLKQSENKNKQLQKQKDTAKQKEKKHKLSSRGSVASRGFKKFKATAYCDNAADQEQYVGMTATGFSVAGKSRLEAKCIAVDPRVIPLGSKVELQFSGEMAKYSGIYIARDTGGAIKGNKIDLFMGGANTSGEVKKFGVREVNLRIIQ